MLPRFFAADDLIHSQAVQGIPASPRVAAKMIQKLQAENSALQEQLRSASAPTQSARLAHSSDKLDACMSTNCRQNDEITSSSAQQHCKQDSRRSHKQAAAGSGGLSARIASLEPLLDTATKGADDERVSHLELKRQYAKNQVCFESCKDRIRTPLVFCFLCVCWLQQSWFSLHFCFCPRAK